MSREQQIAWNRQTLDGWESFREHRLRITELLTDLAPHPAGRLAVLGAGNCNDLDLRGLSQLMLSVTDRQDQRAPQDTIAAVAELRRQHFQHLLSRMRPGARGLLSFEIVSSDTLPSLLKCSAEAVPNLTAAAVGAGNFYTGLHPAAIFQTASQLAQENRVSNLQMHPPWKWYLGPRTYAVAALSFCRLGR